MTWHQELQSEETCKKILEASDQRSFAYRAARLASIPVITSYVRDNGMPGRVASLLSEAGDCYVEGHFQACIATLAIAAEHGLRIRLGESMSVKLAGLIRRAVSDRYIDDWEADSLRHLSRERNAGMHSDMDSLVAGVQIARSLMTLTPDGMRVDPDNEEEPVKPETSFEKEIAAALIVEHHAAELYNAVRRAMYNLFDRQRQATRRALATGTMLLPQGVSAAARDRPAAEE